VAAETGVSPAALAANIRDILPASAQVRTGAEQAQASAKDTKTFMKFIQLFLLAFGGIALFVGAFVIFNTLSITVAQRTREFATLRALGASRRQVLRSVLLEGFVIGLVASLVGLLLGVGLAKGLTWLLGVLQLDLPQTGTVFQTRTVVVSLLVGVGITLVATVGPALRATRVPPIAAIREGSILPRSRFAPVAPFVALGLIAAGAAAFGTALGVGALQTRSVLLLIAVGCISVFLGVGLIASRLVRPLVKVVGQPARHGGGEAGRLASENAVRNPSRTASTAAALMIGLALVTVVATLGTSMRNSDKASIASQLDTDFVVTSENGFDVFQAQAGDLIASVPGVGIVTNVRQEKARIAGATATVHGVDPTIGETARFQWAEGNDALLADLGAGGVILKQRFADKHNLAVGSTVSLLTPAGERHSFTVRGLFQPAAFDRMDPFFGDVVMSRSAFDSAFARPQNILALVELGPDATPATLAGIRDVLDEYPGTIMRDEADYVTSRAAGVDKLLNLLYVLLALSVIVSLFGMINTLVLSTFERTRELGMLRAVGMTRRQVRRMVRHESVITALIGAALGLPIGVALAALMTRALSDQGLVFSVSIRDLAVFTIVAVVAGVVAAIAPARRAARLNVLAALHYE
ncbi:MAG: ABC transporter permease, partial [Gaiellaceae bacterium]